MNNDLISRSALLELAHNHVGGTVDCNDIARFPAVDAEPVRRGKYGFVGMDMMAGSRAFYFGTCSECRERINFEAKHKNFCPNCGAKMDAEVSE